MDLYQEGLGRGASWRKQAKEEQLNWLREADGLLGECGEGFAWVLYCVLHGLDHEQADIDQSHVEHFWESILGEEGDSKIEDEDFRPLLPPPADRLPRAAPIPFRRRQAETVFQGLGQYLVGLRGHIWILMKNRLSGSSRTPSKQLLLADQSILS